MGERGHSETTTDTAHGGAHDNRPPRAPEAEDVLALILDQPAAATGQGQPTDEQPLNDESFDAYMASCRDRAPAVGLTPPFAPKHAAPRRQLAAPTQDPSSAFRQAHLRRDYAALEPMAASRTAATVDGHPGGCILRRQRTRARTYRAHRPTGPTGRRPRTPPAGQRTGKPYGWRHLGERRDWTKRNCRRAPTTPTRRRSVQQPLTWIRGPPRPPTQSSSPSSPDSRLL